MPVSRTPRPWNFSAWLREDLRRGDLLPAPFNLGYRAKLQLSLGGQASIISTVTGAHRGRVTLKTAFGTTRLVNMLAGDQLPRIC